MPARATISGQYVRLEPLDAHEHGESLAAAFAADETLWNFMAYGPFEATEFCLWLEAREKLVDPMIFAIVEAASGRALGLLGMMAIRPEAGVVELGHIVMGKDLQRTSAATEAIYLALRTLFDLGYRRIEWKCDARNSASKRAARRFGFLFEGLFHQHMVVKGANRDTAWFAMLDAEWAARRTAFEGWLKPENFDAAGRQLRPLVLFDPD